MGLLSDIFGIDDDTEKDIKDVLKFVGTIATILIAGDVIGINEEKEDYCCITSFSFKVLLHSCYSFFIR